MSDGTCALLAIRLTLMKFLLKLTPRRERPLQGDDFMRYSARSWAFEDSRNRTAPMFGGSDVQAKILEKIRLPVLTRACGVEAVSPSSVGKVTCGEFGVPPGGVDQRQLRGDLDAAAAFRVKRA